MINATTSLFPLLTIDAKNSFYYNASILCFSLIATANHVLPENLDGLTHFVKMLFSNILFSLINLNPVIGLTLSLSDLTPLFSSNKKVKNFGELFLQIPRQLIEVYLIYKIFNDHSIDCLIMIICKLIYFIERRARIKKGIRNDFSSWHSAEHIGIYLLFKDSCGVEFSFSSFVGLFILFVISVALFLHLINVYLHSKMMDRAPKWLAENTELKAILQNKLTKNKSSRKLHNYIIKPWTSHMKLEFVSWECIQNICDQLVTGIDSAHYDLVVGITTGGSFVGAYVAQALNKPFAIINSKLWSDISFTQNFFQSVGYFMGSKLTPKIGEIPDIKGKRILLVDDTTYTGITIKNIIALLEEKGQPQSICTFVMWMRGNNTKLKYCYSTKRIPLIWEWGSEVD